MNLTKEDLQNLVLAGRIANLTLINIEKYVKPGVSIGNLYDSTVKLITKTPGVGLAFPPNISMNECAAHDTAAPNEKRVIPKRALVKIDIGANVNGMLSDTARTFSTDGKNMKLIKSATMALDNAIRIIKPGIRISEIGNIVQDTIEGYGFKPISNLTGHQLEKEHLHSGVSIPSVKSVPFAQRAKIKKGMLLAIEPFSTNGSAGYIVSSGSPLIYSSGGNPRSDIGKILVNRFQKLPFSLRTAENYLKKEKIKYNDLNAILDRDRFNSYKPLVEKSKGIVAQAEHTVLVTSKGAKIIT
ncbi:MAG: M24 family metallopeptidase [Candidatus Hodarchaeales archaeon]